MPSGNIIQVSEYEKLYYNEETAFKQQHWEALCSYLHTAGRHNNKLAPYFQIINKGIRFTNYVGVIQAGNLTIEILPKTDTTTTNHEAENNKQLWHSALLQMLAECKLIPVHYAGNAWLSLRHRSILEVYLSLFLDEAESLLHEGLLKQYQQQEGNKTTLKGQLLISRQLQQNTVHQERFYVRAASYESSNVFNIILYQTVQTIAPISPTVSLLERANRLLVSFPSITPVSITAETFTSLVYHRKTERYRQAMQIAKMLLLNYRPDIIGGREKVMAILFDMNLLWEEWVYRRLKKEETAYGITVLRQQATSFWKAEHHLASKTIRPDIVIKSTDGTITIIDTKWKLVKDLIPDDADLKQLFIYNLYWQCSQGVLLYPATDEGSSKQGSYTPLPQLGGVKMDCRIITQSIFNDHKIDADFGKRIVNMILLTV